MVPSVVRSSDNFGRKAKASFQLVGSKEDTLVSSRRAHGRVARGVIRGARAVFDRHRHAIRDRHRETNIGVWLGTRLQRDFMLCSSVEECSNRPLRRLDASLD